MEPLQPTVPTTHRYRVEPVNTFYGIEKYFDVIPVSHLAIFKKTELIVLQGLREVELIYFRRYDREIKALGAGSREPAPINYVLGLLAVNPNIIREYEYISTRETLHQPFRTDREHIPLPENSGSLISYLGYTESQMPKDCYLAAYAGYKYKEERHTRCLYLNNRVANQTGWFAFMVR